MFYEKLSFRNWVITIKMSFCLMFMLGNLPESFAKITSPMVAVDPSEVWTESGSEAGEDPLQDSGMSADDGSSTALTESSGSPSPLGGGGGLISLELLLHLLTLLGVQRL